MPSWLDSAALIDAVIAVTLIEVAALLAWRRLRGTGLAPRQLLLHVAAGLFLMLGARSLAVGSAWPWLPLCLAAAGLCHAIDLRARWRVAGSVRGTATPPLPSRASPR
jgi:hypothetical protein